MKYYTGFEYICIDIANQWGLDKEVFEKRIDWALHNINDLEVLGQSRGHWKEAPLYFKAVQALRDVQAGKPTGHMIGLDATASGLQIKSAISGCISGAKSTNLVDPDTREDAYADLHAAMEHYIPGLSQETRDDAKQAAMTAMYGSKAEPEKLFGKGSKTLQVFYQAMYDLFTGGCQVLDANLNSWQPFAMKHSWVMPDNHHVHIKVMSKFKINPKIEELGGMSFTYIYSQNVGQEKGLSNAAN